MLGQAASWWRSIWHSGLPPRSGEALLFAAISVALATALRFGLGRISPDSAVFAPYYSATLVAALVGGAESGMLATILGAIAAFYLFTPPDWSFVPFRLEQSVSFLLYGMSSTIIIWSAHSYRKLLQRLRANDLARELLNQELVHRIKNILATVQGIIGCTLGDQSGLRDAINAIGAAPLFVNF